MILEHHLGKIHFYRSRCRVAARRLVCPGNHPNFNITIQGAYFHDNICWGQWRQEACRPHKLTLWLDTGTHECIADISPNSWNEKKKCLVNTLNNTLRSEIDMQSNMSMGQSGLSEREKCDQTSVPHVADANCGIPQLIKWDRKDHLRQGAPAALKGINIHRQIIFLH